MAAGTLSPVSADSSICSALAATMRPSAGTWSPAARSTTSPTTSSSAGISRLGAVAADPGGGLHHRLERVHRALGLALLAQADDRVQQGERDQQDRRAPLRDHQRDDRGGDQDDLHVAAVLRRGTAASRASASPPAARSGRSRASSPRPRRRRARCRVDAEAVRDVGGDRAYQAPLAPGPAGPLRVTAVLASDLALRPSRSCRRPSCVRPAPSCLRLRRAVSRAAASNGSARGALRAPRPRARCLAARSSSRASWLDRRVLRVDLDQRVRDHRRGAEPREPLVVGRDDVPRRPGRAGVRRASPRTRPGSRPSAPAPSRRRRRTSSSSPAGRAASGTGCAAPPWTGSGRSSRP